MTDLDSVIAECERLYADVCLAPGDWNDAAMADWVESLAAAAIDREVAKEVRKVVRLAGKLQAFWSMPAPGRPPDHGDWKTRVDIALGPRAWRPLLQLSRLSLERSPTEERYEEVRRRFREATGEQWMAGVSYGEWLAGVPAGDG